jgi:SAM-dependent methyltransferase
MYLEEHAKCEALIPKFIVDKKFIEGLKKYEDALISALRSLQGTILGDTADQVDTALLSHSHLGFFTLRRLKKKTEAELKVIVAERGAESQMALEILIDLNADLRGLNLEGFRFQENPFFVMREAHRVLKSGGVFTISVPNPFNFSFRLKFLFTGNMSPWTEKNHHLLFLTNDVFKKTYLSHFNLLEIVYQRGSIPMWGRLRALFGKKLIKKHAMILPRSKLFGRAVCYILQKPI